MKPPLVVAPVTVSRRRHRLGRRLAQASFMAAFAPMLAAWIVSGLRAPGSEAATIFAWLSVLVLCPLLAATSALVAASTRAGFGGDGALRVTRSSLVLEKEGRAHVLPREQIADVFVVPPETGVAVELASGDSVFVSVPDEALAYAMVERLGFGPDKRRVTIRLSSPQRKLAAGTITAVVAWIACSTLFIVASILTSMSPWDDLALAGLMLLPPLFTALFAHVQTPHEIVVGRDGILVRQPFGQTYHPHSDIEDVFVDEGKLFLRLRGQKGIKVVARGEHAFLAAAARRISGARTVGEGAGEARALPLLDRQGRSLAAFRGALEALVRDGDYRRAALTPEVLWSVLEDPKEEPSRRLGAAMLLRKGEAQAARRIRIAADVCVDDDMRAALERAAEDEIDEATFERAVTRPRSLRRESGSRRDAGRLAQP